jgi:branched-chain amino acid transport system substrate-binding protein
MKIKYQVAAALLALASLTAHAQEKIKLGIAYDLSGPFAALGAEARDGFNLALKQLDNKLGGVPVEIFSQDMAGNPDQAKQLVDRYIQKEKIDFFTGPIGSNVALAVGPALFGANVFYISNNPGPSQYAGAQCNPFWFSSSWQNDAYNEAAGIYFSSKNFRNVVVLAPNYPAGRDMIAGFKRTYKGKIGEEVYTKLGQLDYAAELAQIRALKPDALYFFLPGGMGVNFIKQFVGAGLSKDTQLIAPGFSADEDTIRSVGEPMLGLLNTTHYNHDFDNPVNKAFTAAFSREYGAARLPTVYASQAYDAIMMLDAAVREVKGKVSDKDAVRKALAKASFKSTRGDFKVGSNHYPVQSYYLRVVSKDSQGRITNKTIAKILDNHKDVYGEQCKMK